MEFRPLFPVAYPAEPDGVALGGRVAEEIV